MFEKLTDLSFERNWKQAIGFCLVFFLSLILLSLVIGIVNFTYISLVNGLPKVPVANQAGFAFGEKIILLLKFLSTAVAILTVRAKKAYSVPALIGVFLAAGLSISSFFIFSLIPIAYLTTLPKSTPQGS